MSAIREEGIGFGGADAVNDNVNEEKIIIKAKIDNDESLTSIDLDKLIKAIKLNGVTILVFNKLDILESLQCFRYIQGGHMFEFGDVDSFCHTIETFVKPYVTDVIFSRSATDI